MEAGTLKKGDRVTVDPYIFTLGAYQPSQTPNFEVEDIYRQGERFEQIKLKDFGAVHPSWLKLVEPEEVEANKTIAESDFNALITAVFDKIASLPYYDEDGMVQDRGIGEMGDTRDEAKEVVKDWMEAQNIKLID